MSARAREVCRDFLWRKYVFADGEVGHDGEWRDDQPVKGEPLEGGCSCVIA